MNDQEIYYYSDLHAYQDMDRIKELLSKQPIQTDEVALKQASCSHVETDKFILRNGNEMIRCRACKKWDSE